jgi:hypothetical protein
MIMTIYSKPGTGGLGVGLGVVVGINVAVGVEGAGVFIGDMEGVTVGTRV